MRAFVVLVATVTVVLAVSPTAQASLRRCPQADPANGINSVHVSRISCRAGFAVARRTNSVKCFLNGNTCRHRYRGRTWRCRFRERSTGGRVTCVSGRRSVVYRTP